MFSIWPPTLSHRSFQVFVGQRSLLAKIHAASKDDGARGSALRGLVFRHRNNGAGERAVGLSQLIENREVIGVGDRYQVAWDMPLRAVGMVMAADGDHGRYVAGAVG